MSPVRTGTTSQSRATGGVAATARPSHDTPDPAAQASASSATVLDRTSLDTAANLAARGAPHPFRPPAPRPLGF